MHTEAEQENDEGAHACHMLMTSQRTKEGGTGIYKRGFPGIMREEQLGITCATCWDLLKKLQKVSNFWAKTVLTIIIFLCLWNVFLFPQKIQKCNKNEKICIFCMVHHLVCPTYKESPKTDIMANYNVVGNLQNFGLSLTCCQHDDDTTGIKKDIFIIYHIFS